MNKHDKLLAEAVSLLTKILEMDEYDVAGKLSNDPQISGIFTRFEKDVATILTISDKKYKLTPEELSHELHRTLQAFIDTYYKNNWVSLPPK